MLRIVDACCVINLYAGGNMLKLLPAVGGVWHVPVLVTAETLYVRKPDPDDAGKLIKEAIDLKPALDAGVLRACDVASDAETALFVELAVALDDGEAMSLAIAQSRGWMLATDDHKARRLAVERGVPLLSTPELLKRWATVTTAPEAEVARVLKNIQSYARFRPSSNLPEADWWLAAADKTPS